MPRTAAERVASAPRPYTVSVGKATGVSVSRRAAAAADRAGSEAVEAGTVHFERRERADGESEGVK